LVKQQKSKRTTEKTETTMMMNAEAAMNAPAVDDERPIIFEELAFVRFAAASPLFAAISRSCLLRSFSFPTGSIRAPPLYDALAVGVAY
jgi:hypothetical protein